MAEVVEEVEDEAMRYALLLVRRTLAALVWMAMTRYYIVNPENWDTMDMSKVLATLFMLVVLWTDEGKWS